MSIEKRKNIPTENLATVCYLAKFGYLASTSASRSNKNFKTKRIRDDLMFSSVEFEVSRKTESIVKQLQSMEVTWTENQKKHWKEKILKNLKNRQHMNDLIDILLKKCKEHGGPVTDMTDLNKCMKESPKKYLKRFLQQEISLQKLLHQNDVKERPLLYKIIFLTPEQMIDNLTILLTVPEENENQAKDIIFPSEEEIIDILMENCDSFSNTTVTNNSMFYQQQPIAVVWDQDEGSRYWCIAFYCGTSGLEECIIVDNLQQLNKSGNNTEWI